MPEPKEEREDVPPPAPVGFIDEHLSKVVDAGIPGSEQHTLDIEDRAFEDAGAQEEVPKTERVKGGLKFKPTSLHFTSPKIRARKRAFLEAYRQSGVARVAAEKAGISIGTAKCWRAWDEEFAENWLEAEQEALDLIEARLTQGAVEGYLEPVFQGGALVGHVRRFDTKAAMFLLERRRRDIYGTKVGLEHSGVIGLQLTPDDVRAQVLAILPTVTALCQAVAGANQPLTIDVRSDA